MAKIAPETGIWYKMSWFAVPLRWVVVRILETGVKLRPSFVPTLTLIWRRFSSGLCYAGR